MPAANTAFAFIRFREAVVVERYDRVPVDGVIRRVHQEDLVRRSAWILPSNTSLMEAPAQKDIAALIRDVMNNEKAAGRWANSLTR